MAKRVAVFEAIGDGIRDRGEYPYGLELSKDGIRKMKGFSEIEAFSMDMIKSIDCFRSGEVKGSAATGAAAGALLFGPAGAIIGGLAGLHKDAWFLEIKLSDTEKVFRFNSETDKIVFMKWAAKQGLL